MIVMQLFAPHKKGTGFFDASYKICWALCPGVLSCNTIYYVYSLSEPHETWGHRNWHHHSDTPTSLYAVIKCLFWFIEFHCLLLQHLWKHEFYIVLTQSHYKDKPVVQQNQIHWPTAIWKITPEAPWGISSN